MWDWRSNGDVEYLGGIRVQYDSMHMLACPEGAQNTPCRSSPRALFMRA